MKYNPIYYEAKKEGDKVWVSISGVETLKKEPEVESEHNNIYKEIKYNIVE